MKSAPSHAPTAWRSVSALLMPVLVASFVAQQLLIVPKSYHAYLFLSGYGMKSGQFWELFTCQLFHSNHSLAVGVGHLLVNLAGLWFVGRAVEGRFGHGRFLLIYLGAGLAGALAQGVAAVAGFLLPESSASAADWLITRFGQSVGSSIGLCGVLAVYCLWQGRNKLSLLWLVPVEGRWVLGGALFLAALLTVLPGDSSLAHVGHLAGLLTGMLFYKLWRQPAAQAVAGPN